MGPFQPDPSPLSPGSEQFLRALTKGQEFSLIDLLVREAVQNSLDAARPEHGAVRVSFKIRDDVRSETIFDLFPQLRERLGSSLPAGDFNRLLEVRDTGTTGLGGRLDASRRPLKTDSFAKFVFGLGKSYDEDADFGGSWGLGKTIFYRLGCGFVIFYSRCLINGALVDRLAAVLIRHGEIVESIFENETGIHWWAEEVSPRVPKGVEDPAGSSGEIARILSALNIRTFDAGMTGTSVVIPFLRPDPELVTPPVSRPNDEILPWETQTPGAIRAALERWYGVRLDNPGFSTVTDGRPFLLASVCGEELSGNAIGALTRELQSLYQAARTGVTEPGAGRLVYRSSVRGADGGRYAFACRFIAPEANGVSPELLLRREESGIPLISSMRNLGMAMSWQAAASGPWSQRKTDNRSIAVGIVIPLDPSLEGALRKSEGAEHRSWQGDAAEKIRKKIDEWLKQYLSPVQAVGGRQRVADGRRFAELMNLTGLGLEPNISQGGGGGGGGRGGGGGGGGDGGGGGGGGGGGASGNQFTVSVSYDAEGTLLDWSVGPVHGSPMDIHYRLEVKVIGERDSYDADRWASEIQTSFPYRLVRGTTMLEPSGTFSTLDQGRSGQFRLIHVSGAPALDFGLVLREVKE